MVAEAVSIDLHRHGAGGNQMSRIDFQRLLLEGGRLTRIAQHLALAIVAMADGRGRYEESIRELERLTGWGRSTIARHLRELQDFFVVSFGGPRAGKSVFELQGMIEDALASGLLRATAKTSGVPQQDTPVTTAGHLSQVGTLNAPQRDTCPAMGHLNDDQVSQSEKLNGCAPATPRAGIIATRATKVSSSKIVLSEEEEAPAAPSAAAATQRMIADAARWVSNSRKPEPDDLTWAAEWVANSQAQFGAQAFADAYHLLGAEIASGKAHPQRIRTWSEIARRIRDERARAPAAKPGAKPGESEGDRKLRIAMGEDAWKAFQAKRQGGNHA